MFGHQHQRQQCYSRPESGELVFLGRGRMRFATWNLNRSGAERARRQVNFLRNVEWDVVALQEVSRSAWSVIAGSGLAENSFYALEDFGVRPSGKNPHGVALLARNGFQLMKPGLIPDLPKVERALTAEAMVENEFTTIAGWHAPNAAGEGVVTKMRGYRRSSTGLPRLADQPFSALTATIGACQLTWNHLTYPIAKTVGSWKTSSSATTRSTGCVTHISTISENVLLSMRRSKSAGLTDR